MSFKLGLLLSLAFVMSVLLLSSDLLSMSMIHADLDSIALTAGVQISTNGRLDNSIVSFVESQNAHIKCISGCSPRLGDTMVYKVYREFTPLIISKGNLEVSVTRSTVVGYMEH